LAPAAPVAPFGPAAACFEEQINLTALARALTLLSRNAWVTAVRQERSAAVTAIALEVSTAPEAIAASAKTKLSLKVLCRSRIWDISQFPLCRSRVADSSDLKALHNPQNWAGGPIRHGFSGIYLPKNARATHTSVDAG
jgi:hypothetical protein